MATSFSFELLKLRKRPATWILLGILLLAVVLFDYTQLYLAYKALQNGASSTQGVPVENSEAFKEFLLPSSLPLQLTGFLSGFGGPIALILGALAAGSEYGWDTFKTALTQGVGRIGVFASKLLAVGVVLAVFALLAFCVGALSSYVVAGLLDAQVQWPDAWELLKGLGITCFVLGAWASLGIFLATLFRGTALAIGLGLVYGFLIQSLISALSSQSKVVEWFSNALLSKNSSDLAGSLGKAPQVFTKPDHVEPSQAALVILAYIAVSVLLSMLLFRRRDVT